MQLLLGASVLGIWQLAANLEWGNPLFLSSPAEIGAFLWETTTSGEVWPHARATIVATLVAYAIGSSAGITAGLALSMLPRVEQVVRPYISVLNSLPRIALAPLLIIVFGLGMGSKVALAVSLVFFILLENAQAGAKAVDDELHRMVTMYQANKRQRFTKVLLPGAVPAIFAGLRLGVIYALLGVVTAEIIASREGMGQLLMDYSGRFQTDGVYGLLAMLAVVSAVLNGGMALAERWLLRWSK